MVRANLILASKIGKKIHCEFKLGSIDSSTRNKAHQVRLDNSLRSHPVIFYWKKNSHPTTSSITWLHLREVWVRERNKVSVRTPGFGSFLVSPYGYSATARRQRDDPARHRAGVISRFNAGSKTNLGSSWRSSSITIFKNFQIARLDM